MLIKKGGISRNIDERNLASYKAKGFVPVTGEQAAPKPQNSGGEKPIDKMNTDQLKQKAAVLGVDISACTTNKQRIEAIQAHLASAAAPTPPAPAAPAPDGQENNGEGEGEGEGENNEPDSEDTNEE
ncbi:hypothetical protein LJC34_02715 [Oscillospiraceae bacterium OttesenSCG-928-G22]|nr:hypothetical protein [Oscillospiraceae bacterium OttesenSCG-928-G22]